MDVFMSFGIWKIAEAKKSFALRKYTHISNGLCSYLNACKCLQKYLSTL